MAETESGYTRIDRSQLEARLQSQRPDNQDRKSGFALVNVLSSESFAKEHIPGSINIPQGNEDEFEKRFAKDKDIIVYCASPSCDASPKVARELWRRGFERVRDYESGLSDWKQKGNEVTGGAA